MTVPPLPIEAIEVGAHAEDWRAAVRKVGAALNRAGFTTVHYADEMIRMIEEHGPYVVIAPGLALAHARPGSDVLSDGLAIVTLATPVDFGHPHNDPVSVVLGLAVTPADDHIVAVAELANVFNDSDAVAELAGAGSPDEVRAILGAPEDAYRQYVRDVRAEYAHVSDADWKSGRSAFLKKISAAPRIFRTGIFEGEYAGQARKNIAHELATLETQGVS